MGSLQAMKEPCYNCGGEMVNFSDNALWSGIPGKVTLMKCKKCGEMVGSASDS